MLKYAIIESEEEMGKFYFHISTERLIMQRSCNNEIMGNTVGSQTSINLFDPVTTEAVLIRQLR